VSWQEATVFTDAERAYFPDELDDTTETDSVKRRAGVRLRAKGPIHLAVTGIATTESRIKC
jgi:hypothetical protein